MKRTGTLGSTIKWLFAGAAVIGAAIGWRVLTVNRTIDRLLTENRHLKTAIVNLTEETQIGYAKVLSQEQTPTGLVTRIRFVETDPRDSSPILEKEFELDGDVVHFDALVVKFGSQLVMDGKERALTLWRRVYGERMRPEEGFPIEEPGKEPARYRSLTEKLGLRDRQVFWQGIWDLANDPKRLEPLGIKAVFGNVVYEQLRPGRIYIFKADSSGSLYPEVVPDL
ncbi:MAG: hypothetical protein KBE04_06770 [Phycisphaerae bacterium]|nr:hypothetical protein [Phycisphaerae bacterium]